MSVDRGSPPFVYFIGQVGAVGPIKIGCSHSPTDRLTSLMAWSPYPLEVLATTPGDEALERRFHARFIDQRSHGEWFHRSNDLLATIAAVKEGAFDFDALPEPRCLPSRRVVTHQDRANLSIIHRLGWMMRHDYPVPANVVRALYGRHSRPAAERAQNWQIVTDFVAKHHPRYKTQRDAWKAA